jgi:response regulator RpfG family c-di-GMP phosphodiesterase
LYREVEPTKKMLTVQKSIDLVMLVDDNDTDNFISKRIIEITKFANRVEVKNSGQGALEYLRTNENNPDNIPNIIFLDINMPVVDGFIFLSSDNKRDIDKIVNDNHVIRFITKPLTEIALDEIRLSSN